MRNVQHCVVAAAGLAHTAHPATAAHSSQHCPLSSNITHNCDMFSTTLTSVMQETSHGDVCGGQESLSSGNIQTRQGPILSRPAQQDARLCQKLQSDGDAPQSSQNKTSQCFPFTAHRVGRECQESSGNVAIYDTMMIICIFLFRILRTK